MEWERMESISNFKSALDKIIEKYSHAFEHTDVIDLETNEIVEDYGLLRSMAYPQGTPHKTTRVKKHKLERRRTHAASTTATAEERQPTDKNKSKHSQPGTPFSREQSTNSGHSTDDDCLEGLDQTFDFDDPDACGFGSSDSDDDSHPARPDPNSSGNQRRRRRTRQHRSSRKALTRQRHLYSHNHTHDQPAQLQHSDGGSSGDTSGPEDVRSDVYRRGLDDLASPAAHHTSAVGRSCVSTTLHHCDLNDSFVDGYASGEDEEATRIVQRMGPACALTMAVLGGNSGGGVSSDTDGCDATAEGVAAVNRILSGTRDMFRGGDSGSGENDDDDDDDDDDEEEREEDGDDQGEGEEGKEEEEEKNEDVGWEQDHHPAFGTEDGRDERAGKQTQPDSSSDTERRATQEYQGMVPTRRGAHVPPAKRHHHLRHSASSAVNGAARGTTTTSGPVHKRRVAPVLMRESNSASSPEKTATIAPAPTTASVPPSPSAASTTTTTAPSSTAVTPQRRQRQRRRRRRTSSAAEALLQPSSPLSVQRQCERSPAARVLFPTETCQQKRAKEGGRTEEGRNKSPDKERSKEVMGVDGAQGNAGGVVERRMTRKTTQVGGVPPRAKRSKITRSSAKKKKKNSGTCGASHKDARACDGDDGGDTVAAEGAGSNAFAQLAKQRGAEGNARSHHGHGEEQRHDPLTCDLLLCFECAALPDEDSDAE